MARQNPITMLRTTRSALNTQAAASGLLTGEPYLITDEGKIAVATSTSTYRASQKEVPDALPKTSGTSIDLSGAYDGLVQLNYASPTSISSCTNAVPNKVYIFVNTGSSSVTITRGMLYANGSADQVLTANDCMMTMGRTSTTLLQLAPVSVNG